MLLGTAVPFVVSKYISTVTNIFVPAIEHGFFVAS
jgi:hypothetical protein